MTTIKKHREVLAALSDDDLANLHIATIQERSDRGLAFLKGLGDKFYYNEAPNNWHKIPLNRETLAHMGRNPDGSPKPVKEKIK